jgi:hypothetical protein
MNQIRDKNMDIRNKNTYRKETGTITCVLMTTSHKFTSGASLSCSIHQAVDSHKCLYPGSSVCNHHPKHERDTAKCPLCGMYQEQDVSVA